MSCGPFGSTVGKNWFFLTSSQATLVEPASHANQGQAFEGEEMCSLDWYTYACMNKFTIQYSTVQDHKPCSHYTTKAQAFQSKASHFRDDLVSGTCLIFRIWPKKKGVHDSSFKLRWTPTKSHAFHILTALTACNLDKFYVQSLYSQTEQLHSPLWKSFRLFWTALPTLVVNSRCSSSACASDSFAQAVAELRVRNPLSRKLSEKSFTESNDTPQNLPCLELVHQKSCHNRPKFGKTHVRNMDKWWSCICLRSIFPVNVIIFFYHLSLITISGSPFLRRFLISALFHFLILGFFQGHSIAFCRRLVQGARNGFQDALGGLIWKSWRPRTTNSFPIGNLVLTSDQQKVSKLQKNHAQMYHSSVKLSRCWHSRISTSCCSIRIRALRQTELSWSHDSESTQEASGIVIPYYFYSYSLLVSSVWYLANLLQICCALVSWSW